MVSQALLDHPDAAWPDTMTFAEPGKGEEPPSDPLVPGSAWKLIADEDAGTELDGRHVVLTLRGGPGGPVVIRREPA
jgi:hypothetical protein